ncbi:MAG: hypothetical protein HY815_08945 [Candidatus Riflebacteria bacterium]|nr:hypothetical protein [Candidatus Riflebacteria bacterium]
MAKNLVLWFASGLLVTAGSKLGEYLASMVTSQKPAGNTFLPGSQVRELCPQCGRSLTRFSKTLYCGQCGYREG